MISSGGQLKYAPRRPSFGLPKNYILVIFDNDPRSLSALPTTLADDRFIGVDLFSNKN